MSPVLSNITGFGSIEATDDFGCVSDSPFSDVKLGYYDDAEIRPNCIWRALSAGPAGDPEHASLSGDSFHPSRVDILVTQKTYGGLIAELKKGPRVHVPN